MNLSRSTKFWVTPLRSTLLLRSLLLLLTFLLLSVATASAQFSQFARSKDGTPISYESYGKGDLTLVFVHGWNCDGRYWQYQVEEFSKKYHVVVLDLAGHGHSGVSRICYTMHMFGEDVRSVVEASGSKQVILIGHSMGGQVIAEAAKLMPKKVVGLIGVDCFDNIEYPLTRKQLDCMLVPMIDNFADETRKFVRNMISPNTDPTLRDWVIADMAAGSSRIGLSAMEEMLSQYLTGETVKIFDQINVPVLSVNGDLFPINLKANKEHLKDYQAFIVKDADHFLMLSKPNQFNQQLAKAIHLLQRKRLAQ